MKKNMVKWIETNQFLLEKCEKETSVPSKNNN